MKVGLKLLMQLMGGLSAAILTPSNKVLAEDGTIAVDDDKSKRGGFLVVLAYVTQRGAGQIWARVDGSTTGGV